MAKKDFEISHPFCYPKFKPAVQEYTCVTDRLKNSAIPYMSRLLNNIKGAKNE